MSIITIARGSLSGGRELSRRSAARLAAAGRKARGHQRVLSHQREEVTTARCETCG